MECTIKVPATVNSVRDTTFLYPYCKTCLRRIHPTGRGRWSCPQCGSQLLDEQVHYRYRLCVQVTDGHILHDTVAFGPCLSEFFGATADNLRKYLMDLETVVFADQRVLSVTSLLHEAVKMVFCGRTFLFTFQVHTSNCPQSNAIFGLQQLAEMTCAASKNTKNSKQLVTRCISLIPNAKPITSVIEMLKTLTSHAGYELATDRDSISDVSFVDVKTCDLQAEGTIVEDEHTVHPPQNCATPKTPKCSSTSNSLHDLCQHLLHGVTFSPWVCEDQPRTSEPDLV